MSSLLGKKLGKTNIVIKKITYFRRLTNLISLLHMFFFKITPFDFILQYVECWSILKMLELFIIYINSQHTIVNIDIYDE